MTSKTHAFEADTGKILDIVINSLYSNKEIFLRELISNASDAIDKRRYMAATDQSLQSDEPAAIKLIVDSKVKTLTIQDNGIGIPNELIDNLFDPFVTTKSTGTGLGLAFVAKAISDHGGFVEVESMPRLTNFRVMLPKFEPKVFPSTSDHPFQEYLKPGEFP